MEAVVKTLASLTPFDIDVPKIRIGPPADGGYVMADRLAPSQDVISYGISTEYRFDRAFAERGHRVYMFDHTIEGIDAAHDDMRWFKEGLAACSLPGDHLFTIEDHLRRHNIGGDDLLLKMDVEGAEIDALAATPDEVLGRFSQIVVELHELVRLEDLSFRERVDRMLETLNRQFTLFHVHGNNYAGDSPIVVGGLACVNVVELSYIRTSLVQRRSSATLYPTALDHPNTLGPDQKLWFFPFLPSAIAPEAFVESALRLDLERPRKSLVANVGDQAFDTAGCKDVAIGKAARQSSISTDSRSHDEATNAISGTVSETYAFHTDTEERPWWEVDLGADYPIEGVLVFNRADSCGSRAYGFVLKIAGAAGAYEPVYRRNGRPFESATGPARVALLGRTARRIRIELESYTCLHLTAVQVYVRDDRID